MFYLTTHSTHFIYSYMASDIWKRTTQIVRDETRCLHIGYSFRLAARVLVYAPSHRHDSTYHDLCYASRGALAGTRNSSMGRSDDPSHQERTLLPRSYISLHRRGCSGLTPTLSTFRNPLCVWTQYRDANPVSTSPLANALATATSRPVFFNSGWGRCGSRGVVIFAEPMTTYGSGTPTVILRIRNPF